MCYWNENLKKETFVKLEERYCPKCGWNLIDCCANFDAEHTDIRGQNDGDYFIYCGNKTCPNHQGVFYYSGGDYNYMESMKK